MALVVDSWAKVTAIENYEDVAGELLFRRIFEINPGATAFFAFASNSKDGQDDEIYKSKLFKTHSTAVITTVDSAVQLVKSNSMDTLLAVLRGLGAKHEAMNLEQAHYDLVGQALLDTLAKACGPEVFTEECKEAWIGVYKVITENMMEGAKKAKEEGPKKPRNRRHSANSEMKSAMEEIKNVTAEKVNQALLNAEKLALADQERIQAEVDAEMKRVAEFKAKQKEQAAN